MSDSPATVQITLPEPEEVDSEGVAYWGSWQRNDFLSAGPDGRVDMSFAPTSRRVSPDDAEEIAAQLIAAARYARSFTTAAEEPAPPPPVIAPDDPDKLITATRKIAPFSDWRPGASRVHENPARDDLVVIHAHGKWRPALVLSATPRRVRVSYLTPNRLNNADRHYSSAPLTTTRPPDEVASIEPLLEDLRRIQEAQANG